MSRSCKVLWIHTKLIIFHTVCTLSPDVYQMSRTTTNSSSHSHCMGNKAWCISQKLTLWHVYWVSCAVVVGLCWANFHSNQCQIALTILLTWNDKHWNINNVFNIYWCSSILPFQNSSLLFLCTNPRAYPTSLACQNSYNMCSGVTAYHHTTNLSTPL